MKLRVVSATISLILSLAAGPFPTAHARGFGAFSFHSIGRFHSGYFYRQWWFHGRFGNWPGYGGGVGYGGGFGYGQPDGAFDAPALASYPMPAPVAPMIQSAPSCQHSVETVTVPSEEGGTRQIRIERCIR